MEGIKIPSFEYILLPTFHQIIFEPTTIVSGARKCEYYFTVASYVLINFPSSIPSKDNLDGSLLPYITMMKIYPFWVYFVNIDIKSLLNYFLLNISS